MMTENEMRIAIAGKMGFTEICESGPFKRLNGKIDGEWFHIPNYPADLNACHEMEKVFHADYNLQCFYMQKLRDVCYRTKHSGETIEFAMANARPIQRCLSFCRVFYPERWE